MFSFKEFINENFQQYLDLLNPKILSDFFFGFIFSSLYYFAIFIGLLFISKFFKHKFSQHPTLTPDLIHTTLKPIYWLIFIFYFIGIFKLAADIGLSNNFNLKSFVDKIPKFKNVLLNIFIGLAALNFIKYFQKNYINYLQEKQKAAKLEGIEIKQIDISKVDLIAKFALVALIVVIFFAIVGSFGINLTGLATISGIGGVVIGFATKDLLSNFFGLFSIYMDKPFAIGDNINITDKGIKGIIEEIGLRTTTLITYDKTKIYIPNAIFNTSIIENISRMLFRVFRYEVKLKNDQKNIAQIHQIVEELKAEILDFEFVPKIELNPRIDIITFNHQFIDLKLTINFIPCLEAQCAQFGQQVIQLIYRKCADSNIEIVSELTQIAIKQ